MKERRDAPDQLREILLLKTLDAHRLAGASDLFARETGQRLDVAEDVATGKIGRRCVRGGRLNYFHDAAVDNEKRVAGVARGVNRLAFLEMADARQLADRLQLQKLQ